MEQLRHIRVLRDDSILSVPDYDLLHAAILAAFAALSHPEPPGLSAGSESLAPAPHALAVRAAGGVAARKSDAAHGAPPARPPPAADSTPVRPTARPSSSGTPRMPARASTGSAARPVTPVRSRAMAQR